MKAQYIEVIAPSAWASAIVNCDYSGLEKQEISTLNNWLLEQGVYPVDCVYCEDVGFMHHHDASHVTGSANCEKYYFRERV